MPASFLFYDLETFGSDPRRSRIAQFAAIRTDADLNQIDTPISVFVKPADDLLPSPIATVITGIAPQDALRDGVSEAEIFALIFDDEGAWNIMACDDGTDHYGGVGYFDFGMSNVFYNCEWEITAPTFLPY